MREDELKIREGFNGIGIENGEMYYDPRFGFNEKIGRVPTTMKPVTIETSDGQLTKQFKLNNGLYVSTFEVMKALQKSLKGLDERAVIVSRKAGSRFDPSAIIASVLSANDALKVDNINDRGTLVGKDLSVSYTPKKFQNLRVDRYLNLDEFLKAIDEYVVLTPSNRKPREPRIGRGPKGPEIGGETGIDRDPWIDEPRTVGEPNGPRIDEIPEKEESGEKDREEVVIRVTKKYKNNLHKWLAIIALISTTFAMTHGLIKQPAKQIQEYTNLSYSMTQTLSENDIREIAEQANKMWFQSGLNIGDETVVDKGTQYFEMSDKTGAQKEMVNSKNLEITGFAVCRKNSDGSLTYINSGGVEGTTITPNAYHGNLGDFLNENTEKLDEYDVDQLGDITVMAHFGIDGIDRTGWIDVTDLVNASYSVEDTTQIQKTISDKSSKYSGTIENFEGKTVIVTTPFGETEIPIYDESGNLLESGAEVVGSDGLTYKIEDLELEEFIDENTSERTRASFNVSNPALALGTTALLASLASALYTRNKNKKFENDPYFHEFSSEEEYNEFLDSFEKSRADNLADAFKGAMLGYKVDQVRRLNKSQKNQLYGNVQEQYPNSNIVIDSGRIFYTNEDGTRVDITGAVLDSIGEIGIDNTPVSEGDLNKSTLGSEENGIRK